ncbi:uncharacterized protein MYCFIDRAFT_83096 [Pseudocercospora fijiensis CIRAD86]|uniref:Uncharacterized protein n=1 Tax=Pseudocercospora fijiensis (strain CIRAD86) TaxID=383855 RepID=M3B6V5_PSEFD|nr:uncharacterized protein MYCFIDRAFT_83096 [Pseudocercospora fijiensis CIRAD86]EME85068.1 hypothetical protein MYCFIDRAFT_83096 [Pseudocercospora fijiensis CIRAD86]
MHLVPSPSLLLAKILKRTAATIAGLGVDMQVVDVVQIDPSQRRMEFREFWSMPVDPKRALCPIKAQCTLRSFGTEQINLIREQLYAGLCRRRNDGRQKDELQYGDSKLCLQSK